jgi:hypothetical protein
MPDGSTAPFIYTLLAYRPNGERWFRDQCEARSDSIFEFESGDRNTIAEYWAEHKTTGEPGAPDWELSVLINGRTVCSDGNSYYNLNGSSDSIDEFDDPALYAERLLWDEVSAAALKRHNDVALAAQEKVRLAKEHAARVEAEKKAEAQRLKDLAELARLQEKYKPV